MNTLWHGRFGSGPSEALTELNNSLSYDRRLLADDVAGSIAHVKGLVRAHLLSAEEGMQLQRALKEAQRRIERGEVVEGETDEDIHTLVERVVTEIAGPVGGKLHTARSRNDQVATDLRLYLKREILSLSHGLVGLQYVLLERATQAGETYLPGYTHLQRAQPVLLAHQLCAHGWALARDVDRLLQSYERLDVSPLGAGALAGTSLPIQPELTARDLGFARAFENSIDAVADRDFVAEVLFDVALCGTHLSRVGEEVLLWTSSEFGFATLDDAFSTGSSMMPQKKNADIAELARGKSGRFIGNLTGFLATLKGVPFAYNKDFQEDKEPLFDSIDQLRRLIVAVGGMIQTMTFHDDVMKRAADESAVGATDIAEWLVECGTPFREAHAIVGAAVRRSLESNESLHGVVLADPQLGEHAAALLQPGVSVQRRTSAGAGGPLAVAAQLTRFADRIRLFEDRLIALKDPDTDARTVVD